MGVESVADEFVDEYSARKEEGTTNGYFHAATGFLGWLTGEWDGDLSRSDLAIISSDDIDGYLDAMARQGYSDASRLTRYNYLRSFCSWLMDKGVLDENPAQSIDLKGGHGISRKYTRRAEEARARGSVVYLEMDEYEQLVTNVHEPKLRNELLIKLMMNTGIRPSEAVKIRIRDIDREERRIMIDTSKRQGHTRPVWYSQEVGLLLNRWLESDRASMPTASDSPYLFITRYSEQMSARRPNRVVDAAAEDAGIQEVLFVDPDGRRHDRITAHTLRHSYAVHSVRSGMDVRTLQMLMGHESISTTEKYLEFRDDTLRQETLRHAPA